MAKYYAVIKYTKGSAPVTTGEFDAQDHGEALKTMAKIANVQDTLNLYEYELLHVVGRNYSIAGRKIGDDRKLSPPATKERKAQIVGRLVNDKPEPFPTVVPKKPEPVVKSSDFTEYKKYTVGTL